MRTASALATFLAPCALLAGGVAQAHAQTQEPPRTEQERARGSQPAKLQVMRQEPVGAYLSDGDGHAVYLFTNDPEGTVTCTGQCAEAWPPVYTSGAPEIAGTGVEEGLVGTVRHPDGGTQVTYGGHPLYYFARDRMPGQIQGQDVHGFGGEWYLVTPSGDELESHGAGEAQGRSATGTESDTDRGGSR